MVQRSKILIVEDEPFKVDLLVQELEELGYDTISAANGQEALDQVAFVRVGLAQHLERELLEDRRVHGELDRAHNDHT